MTVCGALNEFASSIALFVCTIAGCGVLIWISALLAAEGLNRWMRITKTYTMYMDWVNYRIAFAKFMNEKYPDRSWIREDRK